MDHVLERVPSIPVEGGLASGNCAGKSESRGGGDAVSERHVSIKTHPFCVVRPKDVGFALHSHWLGSRRAGS